MSISGVNSSGNLTGPSGASSGVGPGGRLDKQAFLMLLVAQLRNQDPLNPMQDREFITQLAQLNTLEQMQQLNETITALAQHTALGQAVGYLGHVVTGRERQSGELVSGEVMHVTILDGSVVLELASGEQIDLRDVVAVQLAEDGGQPGEDNSASEGTDGA